MVEHLKELLQGRAVECPIYDFATHLRKENETIRVEPRPIILVEGILIFCDSELRDRMDLKVYVDVEADKRILRRIGRDLVQRGRSFDSIVSQYLETVKPMHDRYVEPSKQYADLIVPFGGKNVAAIQVRALEGPAGPTAPATSLTALGRRDAAVDDVLHDSLGASVRDCGLA
jgi:uridine kinase